MNVHSEVIIMNGLHQWQHGRVEKYDDKSYSIPFCTVALRNKSGGGFLKNKVALVPSSYCIEFDINGLRERELAKVAAKYGAESKQYAKVLKALAML